MIDKQQAIEDLVVVLEDIITFSNTKDEASSKGMMFIYNNKGDNFTILYSRLKELISRYYEIKREVYE